jgi:general secretion pathway protein J
MELSPGGRAKTVTLLQDVSAFDVSYFGPDSDDRSARWQDEWQNRTSLPALVKIRARFAEKGAVPWPDLIVAPKISADVSCRFDPIAQKCGGH